MLKALDLHPVTLERQYRLKHSWRQKDRIVQQRPHRDFVPDCRVCHFILGNMYLGLMEKVPLTYYRKTFIQDVIKGGRDELAKSNAKFLLGHNGQICITQHITNEW